MNTFAQNKLTAEGSFLRNTRFCSLMRAQWKIPKSKLIQGEVPQKFSRKIISWKLPKLSSLRKHKLLMFSCRWCFDSHSSFDLLEKLALVSYSSVSINAGWLIWVFSKPLSRLELIQNQDNFPVQRFPAMNIHRQSDSLFHLRSNEFLQQTS